MCPRLPDVLGSPRDASSSRQTGRSKCACHEDTIVRLYLQTDREVVKKTIKVGKRQCKCNFDMEVDGTSCKKSKGSCDKKCNGVATGVELVGMYLLDMKVKKGKVAITNCEVMVTVPPTLLPTGSGLGGGGLEGTVSRCACVAKGMGGSNGSGPTLPPPTGSGSGLKISN